MKRTILLLGIITLLAACNQKETANNKKAFNLTVTAKNFPDSTKVLLRNRNIGKYIDSSYVINEKFNFSGEVDLPSLSYLEFKDKEENWLKPFKYFMLENENIYIEGEYSKFEYAKVKGSYQSELYQRYDSIGWYSENSDRRSKQLEFLYSNANNQMALTALLFERKTIAKDSLLMFYNKLDSLNANSKNGQKLMDYASSTEMKAGSNFRNISGKDLRNNQYKLSDFKGKVILLDFWSSGCLPCRLQNKNEFPDLIKKYNEDDFVLISYSLDMNKSTWKKSSNDDNITWLNISDLNGYDGENIKKYAVTALPNSFLIDKNGIVVKSFIGFSKGENDIEKEIDKLLK
ncbi:redoxin family protein [Nonlabens sp. Asnod2-A12]|uniref:redoxin family protein n=1 Tax=Nonlabens sp. Asnod2-A12 TaxID=3160578 RepID=UPI00386923B0